MYTPQLENTAKRKINLTELGRAYRKLENRSLKLR